MGKELDSYITAKRHFLSRLRMDPTGFKSMTSPSTLFLKGKKVPIEKDLTATTNTNLSSSKLNY